jgi:hypothetical protein
VSPRRPRHRRSISRTAALALRNERVDLGRRDDDDVEFRALVDIGLELGARAEGNVELVLARGFELRGELLHARLERVRDQHLDLGRAGGPWQQKCEGEDSCGERCA